MKDETAAPPGPTQGSTALAAIPLDSFYVVLSRGGRGERDHHLCSVLYETRLEAEAELARLRAADAEGNYAVWKSASHVDRAEWLHRVVRTDGTLILRRLRGAEKFQ